MTLDVAKFFSCNKQKHEQQKKIDKLDFFKIKSFCPLGDHNQENGGQITKRRHLQITYLIKDLYLDYIKNYYNLRKKDNPIKMGKETE